MIEEAAIDKLLCGATAYVLKQHLARLAEVEARNREPAALLNLTAAAILVTDREGRVTF